MKKLLLIHETIRACERCTLCLTRSHAVPGEGSLRPKVMFIGEAPGRKEDESGRPFCGSAGRNLDLGLEAANLTRSDVFITSAVKCRPPKNRAPRKEELDACRPYLDAQVRLLDPRIIVPLGNVGLRYFFPELSISTVHGTLIMHEGRMFFPSFHPAAIIYNRTLLEDYLADFARLGSLVENERG